ncbi:MAG: carboxypeptidase-like regulatory domain-containing protein, partial [Candidatus Poribacteria bacterium]
MRTFALVTLLGSMLTLVFVFLWMVEGEVPEVVLQPRIPHIEMPDGRAPTTPPDLQSTAPQGIEDTASIVSITRHKELAEKTRLFRGIVVDSRGLPVPGAHVRFSRNGLIAEAEAQSDGRYAALVNDEQLVAEDDNIPSAWELNEIEKHLNAEQRKVFRGKVRAARRKARERPRRMRKRMVDMSAGEVVARCDFDGFISDVQTIEVRSLSDGITEVDFVLLPGSMVKGRVMHSDVRVVGASVYLLDLEYAKLDATRTDEFGEYAFGIENAGLYHILARADGLGAGVLKTQNLSPLWGVDLDELVLIGGGYLKGKVSYPNGDPAHRVNLLVVPETYAHRKQPTVREDELLRLEANGGLAVSRTKTGGDGAFAFSGLADMNFGIRFAPDPHPEAPMVSIHPRGETNIQLHLDSHRLCVIA